jgi:hypothetical protein
MRLIGFFEWSFNGYGCAREGKAISLSCACRRGSHVRAVSLWVGSHPRKSAPGSHCWKRTALSYASPSAASCPTGKSFVASLSPCMVLSCTNRHSFPCGHLCATSSKFRMAVAVGCELTSARRIIVRNLHVHNTVGATETKSLSCPVWR